MAREIHDGVAQDLAGLGYRLDDLATAPGLAPTERGEIREIRIALTESLGQLRRSIFDLRNADSDFLAEVRRLLDEIESKGVQVSFDCDTAINTLSTTSARHLQAIATEALSNVLHHANATRLAFTFSIDDGFFEMTIEDNGIGHVEAREFSYGLATMNERAELIGAICAIGSSESGGTIIRIKAIRT